MEEKNRVDLKKRLELAFEQFLWNSRWLVLIAVVSSLVSAFVLFMVGLYEVVHLLYLFVFHYTYEAFYAKLLSVIIASVDLFLIGTFLLVFALGLYELFISKIDPAENDPLGQRVLVIRNLEDLKEKLGRLVIMVLIVSFFKQVLHLDYHSPLETLYIALGVLLIALALYFTHKKD
ncbi:MAG: YqhA family protein [Aquificae bacterium]|nr:YqhA family protein [Aquificota bacterium]